MRRFSSRLFGLLLSAAILLAVFLFPGVFSFCGAFCKLMGVHTVIAAERLDENTTRRKVPFISVRNKTGSSLPTAYFGKERGTMRSGYCEISWKPIPMMKSIADTVSFYIPQGKIQLESVSEVVEETFWGDHGTGEDHALLYLHGYNIGFEKGCSQAALIQESLGTGESRFLFFSWPSDGAMSSYTHDEADMYWSVPNIQQTLELMIRTYGAGRSNVIGHSMGSRGVLLALVRMSGQHKDSLPLLDNLVLVAADVDTGIFMQYLELIRPLVRRITVYVSENDSALALSEEVHGYARLGMTGDHFLNLDGIEVVDVTATGRRRASGHLYHLYNHTVVNDIRQLLNESRIASKRVGLQRSPGHGPNYWKLFSAEEN